MIFSFPSHLSPASTRTYILPRRRMQVHINPVLLLRQPRLRFTHVLRHRIIANELLRFRLVVHLRGREEGLLERFAVHVQILPIRVGLV